MSISEIGIFLKRRFLSKSEWQCLNPEEDSRQENKEEFLHSTNVSWISTTCRALCQGPGSRWGSLVITQIAVQLGWKEVSGRSQGNTHEQILTRPQISATAAPQQINMTTTQVQEVHDKKARRPSKETQKQCILHKAKELTKASEQPKPRLCWTSLWTLLALVWWKFKVKPLVCSGFRVVSS